MRKAAREAGFFLCCALVIAWVPGCHGSAPRRPVPPPTTVVVTVPRTPASAPLYTGATAVCDVGGHRIVTDPGDAARAALRPCYTHP